MSIDWAALVIVAVVSTVATATFVTLLAGGIRLMSGAIVRSKQGQNAAAVRSAGYTLIALAAAVVLFGIYLILPISR